MPRYRLGLLRGDALTAHLVRRAGEFDVILAENMFGDILSDLAGELSGSLGLAPSINAGAGPTMAQATHGSAPDIAGKGIANPVGMILSAAMLLRWLAGQHGDGGAGRWRPQPGSRWRRVHRRVCRRGGQARRRLMARRQLLLT